MAVNGKLILYAVIQLARTSGSLISPLTSSPSMVAKTPRPEIHHVGTIYSGSVSSMTSAVTTGRSNPAAPLGPRGGICADTLRSLVVGVVALRVIVDKAAFVT